MTTTRGTGAGPELVAAVLQTEPRIGQREANLADSVALISRAAEQGARLMVLPELASSGYMFADRAELEEAAEEIPGGPAVSAWAAACRDHDVYVVAGLPERDGDRIYNSSVLIGPDGVIGTYRKAHLWNAESSLFTPGDSGYPVFDLPIGRVAMLICYDAWFPETFRACALNGAEIVAMPTNWVPLRGAPADGETMANTLCRAGAHSNGLYVLAADRVGTEREQLFIGRSIAVGPDGWLLTGPASDVDPEVLLAPIAAGSVVDARHWTDANDALGDRRPDTYGAVVDAVESNPSAHHHTAPTRSEKR